MKKGKGQQGEDDDLQLWRHVTRNVRAYAPQKDSPAKKERAAAGSSAPPARGEATKPATSAPARRPITLPPFDGGTASKLKKGAFDVEARLDLHGMTQDEAFAALTRFISGSLKKDRRTLLVITGKGRLSQDGGVLRRMLPLWMEGAALRKHVLAFTPARPEHGGSGAFYIRLRKAEKSGR